MAPGAGSDYASNLHSGAPDVTGKGLLPGVRSVNLTMANNWKHIDGCCWRDVCEAP